MGPLPNLPCLKNNALDKSQLTLPSQMCNNAVLNKMLFLDLSWQTLSPGILMDYAAMAAFNRVIAGLSIITCQHIGLPRIARHFMYELLKNMPFHLITGFGRSSNSFSNTQTGITSQGVLQGSSSAGLIFIADSDVSLATYQRLGTGAAFQHPIKKNYPCQICPIC